MNMYLIRKVLHVKNGQVAKHILENVENVHKSQTEIDVNLREEYLDTMVEVEAAQRR